MKHMYILTACIVAHSAHGMDRQTPRQNNALITRHTQQQYAADDFNLCLHSERERKNACRTSLKPVAIDDLALYIHAHCVSRQHTIDQDHNFLENGCAQLVKAYTTYEESCASIQQAHKDITTLNRLNISAACAAGLGGFMLLRHQSPPTRSLSALPFQALTGSALIIGYFAWKNFSNYLTQRKINNLEQERRQQANKISALEQVVHTFTMTQQLNNKNYKELLGRVAVLENQQEHIKKVDQHIREVDTSIVTLHNILQNIRSENLETHASLESFQKLQQQLKDHVFMMGATVQRACENIAHLKNTQDATAKKGKKK
jgi:hypothetical protein